MNGLRLSVATALVLGFLVLPTMADEPANGPLPDSSDTPESETEKELRAGWERHKELLEQGDSAAALDELAVTVDKASFMLPDGDRRTAALQLNYAILLHDLGHDIDADFAFEDARDLYNEAYGEDSIGTVPLLMAEGDRLASRTSARDQKRAYKKALRIVEKEHGRNSLEYADVAYDSGKRITDLSKSVMGESLLKDSVKIYQKILGVNDHRTAQAHIELARVLYAKGRVNSADKLLELALSGVDTTNEADRNWVIDTRRYLARAYVSIERNSKATPHLQKLALLLANGADAEPVVVARVAPDYPDHLAADGVGGSVSFIVEVDAEGFVDDYEILGHDGSEDFVKPAREALQQYRFAPAVQDGQLVTHKDLEIEIAFDPSRFADSQSSSAVPVQNYANPKYAYVEPAGVTRSQRRAHNTNGNTRRAAKRNGGGRSQ